MDINRNDITLLLACTIGIILLSFVTPALGIVDASNETQQSDIPDFSIDANRYDFGADLPERPGSPNSQTVTSREDDTGNTIWLNGGTSGGVALVWAWEEPDNNNDTRLNVSLQDWSSGSVQAESDATISEDNQIAQLILPPGSNDPDWGVRTQYLRAYDTNTTDMETRWRWYITDQDKGQDSWWQRIPVIGESLPSGNQLEGMVGWLGQILRFIAVAPLEFVLNSLSVTLQVATFFFGLLAYLVNTYVAVVSAADSSWAQVVLLIPAVLLWLEFAKIGAAIINLLWIG